MFKVESSAEAKDIGQWEITHVESGEVVAEIKFFSGFRTNKKQLRVKDKVVCEVKNKNEAVEKLEKFFLGVKLDIALLCATAKELENDLALVKNDSSMVILKKEIERIGKEIERLEQYNLI